MIVGVVVVSVARARTIAIVKTATVAVVLASVVVATVAVTVDVPSGTAVGCAVVAVVAVAVCGTALGADDGVDDRAAADGEAQSLAIQCLLDVEQLVASRSESVLFVALGGATQSESLRVGPLRGVAAALLLQSKTTCSCWRCLLYQRRCQSRRRQGNQDDAQHRQLLHRLGMVC